MISERLAKKSLLLVNKRAGNGHATKLADEINSIHELDTLDIKDFFALQSDQLNKLFESLSHIFVLGGDGSSFSLLNLLLTSDLQSGIVITPLGLGGENVLAKSVGSYGRSVATVGQVLMGEYQVKTVRPLTTTLRTELQNTEHPFLWSIHAGFSAAVLSEIELLRSIGASDFKRRYAGTIRKLLQLREFEPVYISGSGLKNKSVIDFGIISAALPYWTSKFKLPVKEQQTAILHTIEGQDRLQSEPSSFIAKFLLELIALKLGLKIPREIVVHRQLLDDFTLSVTTPHQEIAIDSEVFQAESALVTNRQSPHIKSDKILLAKVDK
ncbi:MAG: hypothetical protein BroJett025_05980 [Patescibacteria group bacterium]|nr:MAG: hypothetical protein BroJett025_05980 [Patescibacteria group bacterium]